VSALGAKDIHLDPFLIQPSFQLTGVSRIGVLPSGSLGARAEYGAAATFARLSFSRRFPSLTDRYYQMPGFFSGNPSLQAEEDWTSILGEEFHRGIFDATFQAYLQTRQNAQVQTVSSGVYSVTNQGTANIYSLLMQFAVHPQNWLDLSSETTYSHSHIDQTGGAFPYVPDWISLLGVSVHQLKWSVRGIARFSTSALASTRGDRVAGYGYFDLEARGKIMDRLELSGRVENLLDQAVELVRGYPLGRTFSLVAIGQL
jgi:outer membrane cobalamin receptor